MQRIEFHFNAPSLVSYACRLIRKAQARGLRCQVLAGPGLQAQLDEALWTFSELDFLPHGTQCPALSETSGSFALLTQQPRADWAADVLINLGIDVAPTALAGFARVIEVVSQDELHRAQARQRWRNYAQLGHELVRHDLASAPDV